MTSNDPEYLVPDEIFNALFCVLWYQKRKAESV